MNEDIKNKVWNIDIVIEEIKKFPQTYGTILKERLSNNTFEFILRRKLGKLCNDGTICKSMVPGTRFSRVIFYVLPKEYTILIDNSRTGTEVYVFYDFEKHSNMLIKVNKYWKLKDTHWEEFNQEKIFTSRTILKWL